MGLSSDSTSGKQRSTNPPRGDNKTSAACAQPPGQVCSAQSARRGLSLGSPEVGHSHAPSPGTTICFLSVNLTTLGTSREWGHTVLAL